MGKIPDFPMPLGWSAFSLALSLAGVRLAIRLARKAGMLDVPNERSSHAVPVPRMGGVPMALAALLACGGFAAGGWTPGATFPRAAAASLVLAAIMAALGLRDDLSPLSPRFRFLVQSVSALLGCAFLAATNPAPVLLGSAIPGWLWIPVASVWVVWMTNLYNFMDGIDGLAGGEALLGGLFLSAVFFSAGETGWGAANLFVASASAGFLRYNWSPARIFMGDAGSLFLGAFFGFQSVAAALTTGVPFPVLVLPFANFILDATATLLRRMWRGEEWHRPHRSHFYQRMTGLGLSHAAVTSLEMLSVAGCCAAAAAWPSSGATGRALLAGVPVLGFLSAGWAVARREKVGRNRKDASGKISR